MPTAPTLSSSRWALSRAPSTSPRRSGRPGMRRSTPCRRCFPARTATSIKGLKCSTSGSRSAISRSSSFSITSTIRSTYATSPTATPKSWAISGCSSNTARDDRGAEGQTGRRRRGRQARGTGAARGSRLREPNRPVEQPRRPSKCRLALTGLLHDLNAEVTIGPPVL